MTELDPNALDVAAARMTLAASAMHPLDLKLLARVTILAYLDGRRKQGYPVALDRARAHMGCNPAACSMPKDDPCEACNDLAVAFAVIVAIEALVKERTQGSRSQAFSNWAVSFRTGAAYDIMSRLAAKREQRVEEERRRAADLAEKGGSLSTALTLADVDQREKDANVDFIHGEGWSAKVRADRVAAAENRRRREEEYTRWAAAHPEEARAKEAEARIEHEKWLKKHRGRGGSGPRDNTDYSAFRAGRAAGASVGLDPQVDVPRPAGLL